MLLLLLNHSSSRTAGRHQNCRIVRTIVDSRLVASEVFKRRSPAIQFIHQVI